MFSFSLLKRNLCHIENDKLLTKIFLIIVEKEIFFQEYIEMELKILFIRVFFTLLFEKRVFRKAKTKHSNCNF